jgi:geranylgeranyl diphosphate synthase type II
MNDTRSITAELQEKRDTINRVLGQLLEAQCRADGRLRDALAYSLEAPGKRLRGALAIWCCELVAGRSNRNAEAAAAAVEMVHTYSLIHDDLPAMDDDDMRRGRPTCHRAFDEAAAILAGDALLAMAFEALATRVDDASTAVALVKELAAAAGSRGMVAGQMADLDAERNGTGRAGGAGLLEFIHINKTAKMFAAAAAMGAICGRAGDSQLLCLRRYGLKIGLGFQIADDILDVSATSSQLGKTAGKDAAAGKLTYPGLLGVAESRKRAKALAFEAVAELDALGPTAGKLRELATFLLDRKS